MKLNKSKSIDSLNFISTITNNHNGSMNISHNNNNINYNNNNLNVKFSKRIPNGINNDKLIVHRKQKLTEHNEHNSNSNNNQQCHNSIIQLTKLNKNQSFETYLIQMHKFFKEKKIYLEPNETYKRRTVVLIRPPYSLNSSNTSSTSSESSFSLSKSKSISQFYFNSNSNSSFNTNNINNNNNNNHGEFGFNLQSYGLLNSSTKQTEYICFINNVQPKSVAKKAGLNNGDILLAIDDIKVNEFKSFSDIMKHVKGKNELRLVVMTEQMCKKINLQQRIDQLKTLIAEKKTDLDKLESKKSSLFKKYNINIEEKSKNDIQCTRPDEKLIVISSSSTLKSPAESIISKDEPSTTSNVSTNSSSSIYLSPASSTFSSNLTATSSDESTSSNNSAHSIISTVESNKKTNSLDITNNNKSIPTNNINIIQNSTPIESSNDLSTTNNNTNANENEIIPFDSTPSLNNNQEYRVIYSNEHDNKTHDEVGIDVTVDNNNKNDNQSTSIVKSFGSTTNSYLDNSSNIIINNNVPVKKSSFIRKYIETATNNLTRSLSSNSMNLTSNIKANNLNNTNETNKIKPSSANIKRKMNSSNVNEDSNDDHFEFKTSFSSSSIINSNGNNITSTNDRYKIVLNDITTTSSNTDDDLNNNNDKSLQHSLSINDSTINLNANGKKTYYTRSNSGIKTKNLINLFTLNRSSTSYLSNRTIKSDETQNSIQNNSNSSLFSKKKSLFNKLNVSDNNLTYKNANNNKDNSSSNNNKLRMFNLLSNKPIKIINTQKSTKSNNNNNNSNINIITIDLNNNNNQENNNLVVIKAKNHDLVGANSNNSNNCNNSNSSTSSGGSGYGSACISLCSSIASSSFGTPDQNSLTTSSSSSSSSNSSYRTTPTSHSTSSDQSSVASVTCNHLMNLQSTPTAKITCPISYYRSTSVDSNLNDNTIARIISNGYNFKTNDSIDSFKMPTVLNYSNQDYTITRL
jgi:hypothetical protein